MTPGNRNFQICELADKMSSTPTSMTEDDWQPLRDLGFDDQACLEVARIVGIFNYLPRLADGLGLQLDPTTLEASETETPLKKIGDANGARTE